MRMHAAQVGVNQGPRREFGACGVHADGLQQSAGECFELLTRDQGPCGVVGNVWRGGHWG